MNDDFLYRLRTEPPSHFAESLKARLDRLPRQRAYIVRIGFGTLLFGTALAIVFSFFEQPSPADNRAPQLQVRANEPSDETETFDKIDVTGLNDAISSELEPVPELFERNELKNTPHTTDSDVADVADDAPTAAEPADFPQSASTHTQSEFIVTGPLMYEAGTPSGAVLIRMSLFKVIHWSFKPVDDMLRDKRTFDAEVAALSARRLEQLAPMITDVFAQDTRASNVESRSRDDIWARQADFRLITDQLTRAAGELRMAIQSNDRRATLRAAARVGMTCIACHDAFAKGGASNLPP
jgi:cytochrome c556